MCPGAARTPMGGFRGSLSSLTAPQLGALAIKAAVERAGCPLEAIDEVYMGAVLQVGRGYNISTCRDKVTILLRRFTCILELYIITFNLYVRPLK